MKLEKFFMLGLAGLAFTACSNDDEVTGDALTSGTKQVTVTISTSNYGGARAGSGWTDDTAIDAQNIKVYFLDSSDGIVDVKDAAVGSNNVYHNVSTAVTQIAALANCGASTTLPTTGNWSAVEGLTLEMSDYGEASEAPLFSEIATLQPSGTDATDGNTMYEAEVTLKTMLSRIELSGTLTCSDLGTDAYTKLALTHVGLNGVYSQFTFAGNGVGAEIYAQSNTAGYPATVPACFYDAVFAPVINTTTATALGASFGYNVLGQPTEMLLRFDTEYKNPVTEGWIVYNPAYLKIVALKDATTKNDVTMEPGKIYQITNLEFTEDDLTDLDPNEPQICVTATVTVEDWEIVAVTPEYGE